MTLYEMTNEATELLELLSNPTEEEITDEDIQQIILNTLEGMGLNEKLDSYGKIIRQLTADAAAVKAEKQRLASLQSYLENNAQRMKDSLLMFMDASGSKSLNTDIFRFSIRESKAVSVTDPELIPEEFLKVETTINKADLKKALATQDIPGAAIVVNKSISIK